MDNRFLYAMFGVATSNCLRRCIYKSIHYFDLGVEATRNITHYPLHHVTHAPAEFEVSTTNAQLVWRKTGDRRFASRSGHCVFFQQDNVLV